MSSYASDASPINVPVTSNSIHKFNHNNPLDRETHLLMIRGDGDLRFLAVILVDFSLLWQSRVAENSNCLLNSLDKANLELYSSEHLTCN